MNKPDLKTFCVLPWIHSFVNSNGAYQVCCTSEEYHSGIPDENGQNFNISVRPNIDEVMNSEFMNSLRLDMLNGKWNKICTRCHDTEKLNGVSRRQIENDQYKIKIEDLVSKTKVNGQIENKLTSLDYRLGNLCNLQCRMCGPYSTSNWIKDWNEVMPSEDHLSKEQVIYYSSFNWIEKDLLIDEFHAKITDVDRIHFAGGEPMISPQMAKILEECIALQVAKNITLSYNTNATIFPEKILNLWIHFKEVKLLCSVDGVEKVNNYIRFPSKWELIDKNLKFLDENMKRFNISEILLSCTVQIYNILSLSDLYDYVAKFQNIIPALNLINLHFPNYMSSKVLPKEAKLEATKKLKKIAERIECQIPPSHKYLIENIHQVLNFMNEDDLSFELKKFRKINSNIDSKKKLKISECLPELNSYLINHYLLELTVE